MKKHVLLTAITAFSLQIAFSQVNFQDIVKDAETKEELDDVCRSATLGFTGTPKEIENSVNEILKTVGIQGIANAKFKLHDCSGINNAVAKILKEKGEDVRYVIYDPGFFQFMINETNNRWAPQFVLAHEIGHHISGHSLNDGSSNHQYELDADYFAGRALAMMGASLDDALSATHVLSENATSSHPARADRQKEITRGWNSVENKARTITVRKQDIDEIGLTIVENARTGLEAGTADPERLLAALTLARTNYYKGYTEEIRYLEAMCLSKIADDERAVNSYIDYLSIENLSDKSGIKTIGGLLAKSSISRTAFFENKLVIYELANIYFKNKDYDRAISFGNQFLQFSDRQKDASQISEINTLIGNSEYGKIMEGTANIDNAVKHGKTAYQNGDYNKAFENFNRAALAGHTEARYLLGSMYENGLGSQRDYNKAFANYLLAAQDNHLEAAYKVGLFYYEGKGVRSKDITNAKFWLKRANNHEASSLLRTIEAEENKVSEKEEKEEVVIKKVETDAEIIAKQVSGGDSYFNNGFYKDAYEWYIVAANKGDSYSQDKVAWMLYMGKGVKKDRNAGIEWWKKAARQGNVSAINYLTRLGQW